MRKKHSTLDLPPGAGRSTDSRRAQAWTPATRKRQLHQSTARKAKIHAPTKQLAQDERRRAGTETSRRAGTETKPQPVGAKERVDSSRYPSTTSERRLGAKGKARDASWVADRTPTWGALSARGVCWRAAPASQGPSIPPRQHTPWAAHPDAPYGARAERGRCGRQVLSSRKCGPHSADSLRKRLPTAGSRRTKTPIVPTPSDCGKTPASQPVRVAAKLQPAKPFESRENSSQPNRSSRGKIPLAKR
jgi:hypothetical protein